MKLLELSLRVSMVCDQSNCGVEGCRMMVKSSNCSLVEHFARARQVKRGKCRAQISIKILSIWCSNCMGTIPRGPCSSIPVRTKNSASIACYYPSSSCLSPNIVLYPSHTLLCSTMYLIKPRAQASQNPVPTPHQPSSPTPN